MDTQERARRYAAALNNTGRDIECALARVCAEFPDHLEDRAEAAWEGALLAGVQARQLSFLLADRNWPMLVTIADLEGEDPWSSLIQFQRVHFRDWSDPGPEQQDRHGPARPGRQAQ